MWAGLSLYSLFSHHFLAGKTQNKPKLVTSMAATQPAATGDLTSTTTNSITLLPPAWQGKKQMAQINKSPNTGKRRDSLLQMHLYSTKI